MLLSDTSAEYRIGRLAIPYQKILLLAVGIAICFAIGFGLVHFRSAVIGYGSRPPAPTAVVASNSGTTFSRTDLQIHESDYCNCVR